MPMREAVVKCLIYSASHIFIESDSEGYIEHRSSGRECVEESVQITIKLSIMGLSFQGVWPVFKYN